MTMRVRVINFISTYVFEKQRYIRCGYSCGVSKVPFLEVEGKQNEISPKHLDTRVESSNMAGIFKAKPLT